MVEGEAGAIFDELHVTSYSHKPVAPHINQSLDSWTPCTAYAGCAPRQKTRFSVTFLNSLKT